MSMMLIKKAASRDRGTILLVGENACSQRANAGIIDTIVSGSDAIVERAAEEDAQVVCYILTLAPLCTGLRQNHLTIARAPLFVELDFQCTDIGDTIVRETRIHLKDANEILTVVLGDQVYYGRFDYYDALQTLAWYAVSEISKLVYASTFSTVIAA